MFGHVYDNKRLGDMVSTTMKCITTAFLTDPVVTQKFYYVYVFLIAVTKHLQFCCILVV